MSVKKWDDTAGMMNPVMVHERLDGSYYIVDGHQRVALAQEAPQHRVDEPGALWGARACRIDSLIDQRVIGIRRLALPVPLRPKQRECGQQQRIDLRRGRLGREQRTQCLRRTEPAQRMETQRLRAGPRGGRAVRQGHVQRLAYAHRLNGVGGVVQQLGERQCVARGCTIKGVGRGVHRAQSTVWL